MPRCIQQALNVAEWSELCFSDKLFPAPAAVTYFSKSPLVYWFVFWVCFYPQGMFIQLSRLINILLFRIPDDLHTESPYSLSDEDLVVSDLPDVPLPEQLAFTGVYLEPNLRSWFYIGLPEPTFIHSKYIVSFFSAISDGFPACEGLTVELMNSARP